MSLPKLVQVEVVLVETLVQIMKELRRVAVTLDPKKMIKDVKIAKKMITKKIRYWFLFFRIKKDVKINTFLVRNIYNLKLVLQTCFYV